MGETTKIEWAHSTLNPWTGCSKVSEGCRNCYAERLSKRLPTLGSWGPGAPRKRTSAANWRKPLAWDRRAAKTGERHRVFCASLADWLDPEVPAEWLADLLALIAQTPHLTWMLLTKRPELWEERMRAAGEFMEELEVRHLWSGGSPADLDGYVAAYDVIESWLNDQTPPANVWMGTSVEDQAAADSRIPALLEIPARVRFLSCEPLLGAIEPDLTGIHWVIAGGESGPGARPMHPAWARSLRDQCQAAGVAFHFKQWGRWVPPSQTPIYTTGPQDYAHVHKWDEDSFSVGIGKARTGRLLDGRTWDEVPS